MYKKTKTKKENNNMKNVKTLLIFITISAFMFATDTRVASLGGNAGYWANDVASIGAFPKNVNNHSTAWTDGSDFTSIVNVDGTAWGFAGGSGDDMANVWWGNGTYGVNFGLGMTPEVTAADVTADPTLTLAEANTALNVGFGMDLAGMDFGFTYGMGCDDCGGGNVGINLRRAQNIWLFENILVGFGMGMEGDDAAVDPATMDLDLDLYRNHTYDSGITSLFGLGFDYGSVGDADPTMGIQWDFAVESDMTDWATLRLGYSHAYDFANGGDDGGLVGGLGFNYGSFNLDMMIDTNMFNDPVPYVVGQNDGDLGTKWTISYNW